MVRCMLICVVFMIAASARADLTREQASIPKRLADRIVAESGSLGADAQRKIADSDDVALADASEKMEHASQWRYYSRDRGVMVAIPMKQRLNYADRLVAEKKVADLFESLVYQREDQSVKGAIRVVFIEPAGSCACPRAGRPAGTGFAYVPAAGFGAGLSGNAGAACNCH